MLVEINLLPRRERKSSSVFLLSLIFLGLFLLSGVFYYFQISSINSDISSTEKQLAITKQMAEAEQNKLSAFASSDTVKKLENSIAWAETYPVPSVPVMREFTALLPERGFIKTFAYQESGDLNLTVQFDTSREAAYFLNRLNNSEWVEDAGLTSLTASDQNASTATSSNTDEKAYLPRYIGQFQITLNKNKAKSAASADEDEEWEGASGS